MVQPDEKTLEAIITLSSQKEFDFIMKLLDDSIHSLHFANINSTGEIRLWNQGKLQELINLRNLFGSAQARLIDLKLASSREKVIASMKNDF